MQTHLHPLLAAVPGKTASGFIVFITARRVRRQGCIARLAPARRKKKKKLEKSCRACWCGGHLKQRLGGALEAAGALRCRWCWCSGQFRWVLEQGADGPCPGGALITGVRENFNRFFHRRVSQPVWDQVERFTDAGPVTQPALGIRTALRQTLASQVPDPHQCNPCAYPCKRWLATLMFVRGPAL